MRSCCSPDRATRFSNGSPVTGEDVILVGPGAEYEALTPADYKPAVFYIRLDLETSVPLRRLANQHKGRIHRVADPQLARRFRVLAASFLHSWDKRTTTISLSQSALQGLMFDLLTSPAAANGSSHPSIQLYRAARDVMLDALAETLTITEIASRVGTSRRTLEKTFDDCVSVSPARFPQTPTAQQRPPPAPKRPALGDPGRRQQRPPPPGPVLRRLLQPLRRTALQDRPAIQSTHHNV